MRKLEEMTDEQLALAYVEGQSGIRFVTVSQRGETVRLYHVCGSRPGKGE